jgi:5-methylcytosine-specific restriction enzyme A
LNINWDELNKQYFSLREIYKNPDSFNNFISRFSQLNHRVITTRTNGHKYIPDDYIVIEKSEKENPPEGNREPKKISETIFVFERDTEIKKWILDKANGICECCGNNSPFKTDQLQPYLEVHHIRALANGGSDTISNTIGICPNCHRELHYGEKRDEIIERLYENIERLEKE